MSFETPLSYNIQDGEVVVWADGEVVARWDALTLLVAIAQGMSQSVQPKTPKDLGRVTTVYGVEYREFNEG